MNSNNVKVSLTALLFWLLAQPVFAQSVDNQAIFDSLVVAEKFPEALETADRWAAEVQADSNQLYQVAVKLHNTGAGFGRQGVYDLSLAFLEKAIPLFAKTVGTEHRKFVRASFTRCVILGTLGQYEGLEVQLEALKTTTIHTRDTIDLSRIYEELGNLKLSLGLDAEAIQLFQKAQKLAETNDFGLFVQFSASLARAYYHAKMDKAADAEWAKIFQAGKKMDQAKDYRSLVNYKIDRAHQLAFSGRAAESEILLHEIDAAVASGTEINVIETETVFMAKTDIARQRKDFPQAMKYLDEGMALEERTSGKVSSDFFNWLVVKTSVQLDAGLPAEALGSVREAVVLERELFARQIAVISDKDRAQVADQFSDVFRFLQRIHQLDLRISISGDLLDIQLFKKNILEGTTRKTAAFVQNAGDPALKNLYASWLDARNQLADTQQNGSATDDEIKSLEDKAAGFEKNLAQRSVPFVSPATAAVRWPEIAAALREGEAAVDVLRFQSAGNDPDNAAFAYAFSIVKPGAAAPELVFLDNANELESFVAGQYQSEISRKKDISPLLFEKLCGTVAAHLEGVRVLYFSPDGIFHKINLNTLRVADGSYVVDNVEIRQVTNLRNLLERGSNNSGEVPGVAVLFGNPAFKNGASSGGGESSAVVDSRSGIFRELAEEAKGDLHLTPLPGSEREVKNIAQKLVVKNWEAAVFTGQNATEDTLKKLRSPKILHLATHGYFLNSERAAGANGLVSEQAGRNPALRSMLFFAGAENTIAGEKTGREDGILTAFEAAVLPLDKTELVVLSACNTGLGKIQNGEGVSGLQRAFRIAGARSLIMSLWEVEDAATEILMNAFYENWLGGKSKTEAFRAAQLALKGRFPQPFYWGALCW